MLGPPRCYDVHVLIYISDVVWLKSFTLKNEIVNISGSAMYHYKVTLLVNISHVYLTCVDWHVTGICGKLSQLCVKQCHEKNNPQGTLTKNMLSQGYTSVLPVLTIS